MENTENTQAMTETQTTELDRALAAARQRRVRKVKPEGKPKPEIDESSGALKPVLTDEEKAAQKTEKTAKREQKRVEAAKLASEKKAAREAKKAGKVQVERKPAHQAKLERASAKLPSIDAAAMEVYTSAVEKLNRTQLLALVDHLSFKARELGTAAARVAAPLKVGELVSVNVPPYEGVTGTLTAVQRIRCYVEVPGVKKPVYLFISDVSRVETDEDGLEVVSEDTEDETQAAVNE